MPIARFQMPDGRIARFEVPDGLSGEEAEKLITNQFFSNLQQPKEQAGFGSSFKESMSTLLSAPEAARFGMAKKGEEAAAREALIKAQESERVGTSLEDVLSGRGKFTDWAAQLAGGSAGALAAPGAAAAVGALAAGPVAGPVVGAVAGASVLAAQYLTEFLGTQAKEQKEAIKEDRTPEETSLGKAALAATAATGLDVIGIGKVFRPVFKSFPILGRMFGEAGEKGVKETEDILIDAFKNRKLSYKGGIAKGVGAGVAFEIPQEIAQTALERWQAGQSLTDAEARAQYLEAGAGALLLGGSLGAVSGGIKTARDRHAAEQLLESRGLLAKEEEQAAPPTTPPETAVTPATTPPVTPPAGETVEAPVGGTPMAGATIPGVSIQEGTGAPVTAAAPTETAKPAVSGAPAPLTQLTPQQITALQAANNLNIKNTILQSFTMQGLRPEKIAEKLQSESGGLITDQLAELGIKDLSGFVRDILDVSGYDTNYRKNFYINFNRAGQKQAAANAPSIVEKPKSQEAGEVPTNVTGGTDLATATGGAGAVVPQPAAGTPAANVPSTGAVATPAPVTGELVGGEERGGAPLTETPRSVRELITAYNDPNIASLDRLEVYKQLDQKSAAEIDAEIRKNSDEQKSLLSKNGRRPIRGSKKAQTWDRINKENDLLLQLWSDADRKERRERTQSEAQAEGQQPQAGGEQLSEEKKAPKPRKVKGAASAAREPAVAVEEDVSENAANTDEIEASLKILEDVKDVGEYNAHVDFILQEPNGEQILRDAGVVQSDIDAAKIRTARRFGDPDYMALQTVQAQLKSLKMRQDQLGYEYEQAVAKNNVTEAASLDTILQKLDKDIKGREAEARKLHATINDRKSRKYSHPDFVREQGSATDKRGARLRKALERADTLGEALDIAAKLPLTTQFERSILQRLAALPGISDVKFSLEVRFPGYEKAPTGTYDQATGSVALNARYASIKTLIHEAEHAATVDAIDTHLDENDRSLTRLGQELLGLMNLARSKMGNAYGLTSSREFIAEANSNPDFIKQLKQIPAGDTNLFNRFVSWVMKLLGIPRDGRMLFNTAMDISRLLEAENAAARKQAVLAGKPTYQAEAAKTAGTATPEAQLDDYESNIRNDFDEKRTKAASYKNIKNFFLSLDGWNYLVKKFQNERVAVKNLQEMLERTKLIKNEGKFNNLWDQITLAPGRAVDLMNKRAGPYIEALEQAVHKYAESAGMPINDAMVKLHLYSIALHEPERRMAKFLRTVPLNTDPKKSLTITIDKGPGNKPEVISGPAANIRKYIYERLKENVDRTNGPDGDGTAKKYRAVLESIVNAVETDANGQPKKDITGQPVYKYRDPAGESENGYKAINIDDNAYTVVAELSRDAIALLQKRYNADLNKHPELKDVFDAVKGVQDETTAMDKEANYWTKPVSNIVDFYGYQHYVPFKGRPEPKDKTGYGREQADDPRRNPMLTGDFVEGAFQAEGRKSISDNPILQSMADASRAAMRLGRKDVVTAIYNLATDTDNRLKKTLIDTEPPKKIQFSQRNEEDFKQYQTREYILHYNEDGSIDVLKIKDPRLMEGIRRTFRASQPITQIINRLTSGVGQMHTRFNPSFGPMNFVRDMLTNAWTMGTELSGDAAKQYIGAVSSQVANGGLLKAYKFMRMYQRGEFDELTKMAAQPGNEFFKQMREYIDEGGRISYVQGLTAMSQMDEMVKELGRSNLIRSKDQLMAWIDAYTDMFEFTSRAAAYGVAKKMAIEQGLSEEAARTKASAYAKNLANFEQVGEWGRAAGAAFMFFRPAATGAVRAFDALKPMLIPVDKYIKRLPKAIQNDQASVEAYKKNYEDQAKRAKIALMALMGAGATIYMMAYMMSDDDEQGRNRVATDDMARWTRYLRLPVPGTEKFLQVPWGFGLGAFTAFGAQAAGAAIGKTSVGDMLGNTLTIALDSFVPIPFSRINPISDPTSWLIDSLTPSIMRPLVEFKMNIDSLGREIYNNRNTRVGDAYTGGDNIPDLFKDAARMLANATNGSIDISPNTMYFLANNYIDGISRVTQNLYGTSLLVTGQKGFDAKTDLPFIDSFIGKQSNYDAREFASIEKTIQAKAAKLNMFKSSPEQLQSYIESHPMDMAIVDIYNKQIANVNKLREAANNVRRMQGVDYKQRKEMLDAIRLTQNIYKRALIDMFEAYDVRP